jgi:Flp pilus assembly protein TadD
MGGCVAAALMLAGCGGADILKLPAFGPTTSALNISPKVEPPQRDFTPGEAKAARAKLGEAATLAAARSNPRDVEAALAGAGVLRRHGDKAGALALLESSAAIAPNDARLLRDRGLLALELGALPLAREHLRKAVANGSRDWQTHSALGAALAAGGDHKAAQRQFDEALKQAPDNPVVLNNLALSMALEGRRGEAEQMLRRAARKQPKAGDVRVAQNLALVSSIKVRDGKAAKAEAKAIERGPLPPATAIPTKDAKKAAAAWTPTSTRTAQTE